MKKQGQTRRMSAAEVALNYLIGFTIALTVQTIVMEIYGIGAELARDFAITIIFTIVSVLRSYFIRRLFNYLQLKDQP